MDSAPRPSIEQKGVRRMLVIFAALAVVGVLSFAFSRPVGIVVLIVAEVFFVVAYRRFSKLSKAKG